MSGQTVYTYVGNDPLDKADPSGLCALFIFGSDCRIYGNAQKTGDVNHAAAGNADAQRMAASGKYDSVHLNQKLSTITGDPAAGGQQPDVAGVEKGTGNVDTVEHPSTTQTNQQMDAKGADMQAKLKAIGKSGNHVTRSTGAAIEGAGGKVLGAAGALVSVPGAILDRAANPDMSNMEFLYRAFGVYDLGVQSGQLPPPPQTY